jgi:U3 small nucleolar RNA-associated protein 12
VSVYWISESQLCEQVAATLNNNTVELHSLYTALKEAESRCLRKISSHGHHSEVRAVAFSSDNLAVVSASAESVKMWNRWTDFY